MDPSEKGWLEKYIEIKKEIYLDQGLVNLPNNEQELYAYLQPTGILYGHPINLPESIPLDTDKWPVKERMKVILAESLISSGLIHKANESIQPEMDQAFKEVLTSKGKNFYEKLHPGISSSPLGFFKKPKELELAEYLLNKRITVKAQWNANFWQAFFHNILLFTDIIQFAYWTGQDAMEEAHIRKEREDIRLDTLHLIACAAYADDVLESEEKRLFNYFLESADLHRSSKKAAAQLIERKPDLKQIDFSKYSSWLIRKYFLEVSVLTIWADRNVSESEMTFLHELTKALKLNEEELESSMIAVESFVIHNWDKVHYLQTRQNYMVLSQRLSGRMGKIAGKYKDQIKNEIHESKELIALLNKSRNSNLTIEEKEKVREQLIDILKTIPAFLIITLPFTFLTLPILFKILPKSVFPSSFDENRILQRKNRRIIES